ncbi:chaplin family protein [Streptomyces sp. NPDC053755]|uniref:chaplin n=1 Tax=Streptomyces sp. NPDC053755 TaxID=3155815 RepID=UPI003414EB7E
MRQIRRSGLATLMVTGGALALSAGAAHADSGAQGAAIGSPGAVSGNTVQLPVHAPVNICGNTVNVVGLLNPSFGNTCANHSGAQGGHGSSDRGGEGGGKHKDLPATPRGGGSGGQGGNASHGGDGGGATAEGVAHNSPGLLSGNGIQLPIDLPVNVSGNSVNVVGIGNPAFGNTSVNGPGTPEAPGQEPKPMEPRNHPPLPSTDTDEPAPAPAPRTSSVSLASTGSDLVGYAAPASAALLLGGALLYRRSRRAGGEV